MVKDALPNRKRNRPKPDPYTHDEMNDIIAELKRRAEMRKLTGHWRFNKMHLLVELAWMTGLRRHDVTILEWPKIFLKAEHPYMKAFVKNKRDEGEEMYINLNPRAVQILMELQDFSLDRSKWVFPRETNPSLHMSTGWYDRHFKPVADLIAPGKRNPFHAIRQRAATDVMERPGATRAQGAAFLGHAGETELSRYDDSADANQQSLRELMNQAPHAQAKVELVKVAEEGDGR